jgi:hypothetical protein
MIGRIVIAAEDEFDAIFLAGLPDVKGSLPHASEPREP